MFFASRRDFSLVVISKLCTYYERNQWRDASREFPLCLSSARLLTYSLDRSRSMGIDSCGTGGHVPQYLAFPNIWEV